jgi:hypothetical protein
MINYDTFVPATDFDQVFFSSKPLPLSLSFSVFGETVIVGVKIFIVHRSLALIVVQVRTFANLLLMITPIVLYYKTFYGRN